MLAIRDRRTLQAIRVPVRVYSLCLPAQAGYASGSMLAASHAATESREKWEGREERLGAEAAAR